MRLWRVTTDDTAWRAAFWTPCGTRHWRWCRWAGSGSCWCIRARRTERTPEGECCSNWTTSRGRSGCRRHWRCWWRRKGPNRTGTLLPTDQTTATTIIPFDAHCCHMGIVIKHLLADRVKPSFVIFDIRALWRSGLTVRVLRCQKLRMTA